MSEIERRYHKINGKFNEWINQSMQCSMLCSCSVANGARCIGALRPLYGLKDKSENTSSHTSPIIQFICDKYTQISGICIELSTATSTNRSENCPQNSMPQDIPRYSQYFQYFVNINMGYKSEATLMMAHCADSKLKLCAAHKMRHWLVFGIVIVAANGFHAIPWTIWNFWFIARAHRTCWFRYSRKCNTSPTR